MAVLGYKTYSVCLFKVLLFNFFSNFLELPGPGLTQVGIWVLEALRTPVDLIEAMELFLNQKCNRNTAVTEAGLHHWTGFSDGKREYHIETLRGFLSLYPHQYQC